MSSYQRKNNMNKNSMIAAANSKKKDYMTNLTTFIQSKKGDSYRSSPSRLK